MQDTERHSLVRKELRFRFVWKSAKRPGSSMGVSVQVDETHTEKPLYLGVTGIHCFVLLFVFLLKRLTAY